MKNFESSTYPNGLTLHRDGMITCSECRQVVPYSEVQHLDFYSDVGWAQCKACALTKGEYCAVSRERKAPDEANVILPLDMSTSPTNG